MVILYLWFKFVIYFVLDLFYIMVLWKVFVNGFIDDDKKVFYFIKYILGVRLKCKNYILFENKIIKIDILLLSFMLVEKLYFLE